MLKHHWHLSAQFSTEIAKGTLLVCLPIAATEYQDTDLAAHNSRSRQIEPYTQSMGEASRYHSVVRGSYRWRILAEIIHTKRSGAHKTLKSYIDLE